MVWNSGIYAMKNDQFGGPLSIKKTVTNKISLNGKKIMVIRKGEYPIVYDFSGSVVRELLELEGFSTNATIKDPWWISDDLVCCGSDDYGLYIWSLADKKSSYQKYFHRSIINQVNYCYEYDALFSCGIEKYITIWKKNKFMGSESTERRREMFTKSEIDDIFASHHVIRMQQEERLDDYR